MGRSAGDVAVWAIEIIRLPPTTITLIVVGVEPDPVSLLRAYLEDPAYPERGQTWLADLLGISQAAVWQWLHTGNRPLQQHREALERLAGIPADSWLSAEERAAKRAMDERLSALEITGGR